METEKRKGEYNKSSFPVLEHKLKFRFRNLLIKWGECRMCDNDYTLSYSLLSSCSGKGLFE